MADRSRSFLLLINPHAAGGRARERSAAVIHALHESGASFDTALTRGPGDATDKARKTLRDGLGGVAVVGGDGTFNEAVNGFFAEDGSVIAPEAWFGPLPCGTGGDFGRTVGISRDAAGMVTRMMWARSRPIDVGWVRFRGHDGRSSERAFLNVASFGLGGQVDQLVNRSPKWMGGAATFLLGTLRAMAAFHPRQVRITVDDGPTEEHEVINCAVANGSYFGGGMQIAPGARIDDGLFDVVRVEGLGLIEQAKLAPHLYRGTLRGCDGVSFAQARRLTAEPGDWSGSVLLDVDGEAPGTLPATFEIRPGAIHLRG